MRLALSVVHDSDGNLLRSGRDPPEAEKDFETDAQQMAAGAKARLDDTLARGCRQPRSSPPESLERLTRTIRCDYAG
jgi:hypothetical protein